MTSFGKKTYSETKEVTLLASPSIPSVQVEDGSSVENAISIMGNGTLTGEAPLPGPQLVDWNTTMYYKKDLIEGELLELSLTGDVGTDFDLMVWNSSLELVAYSTTDIYPEDISFDVERSGTYYIVVAEYYLSGAGNY
ncbi:MAG: PPC domain-containing protein [Candidatus Kariarchaeaceae archaeon]